MLAKRLLVLDVETTGLEPAQDSIVQLAAAILDPRDLTIASAFSSLVSPETSISSDAQRIHGLSSTELANAPSMHVVMGEFSEFAPADALICGHNVAFDVAFLRNAYRRAGMKYSFDYHTVDLWSIAFFVLGAQKIQLDRYDLKSLCGLYGIPRSLRHDAAEDVRATAAVLRHLFDAVSGERLNVLGQYRLFSQR